MIAGENNKNNGCRPMETASILAQIWGQLLDVRSAEESSPLTEVLGALLKVPVVGLVSNSEVFEPAAMKENEELLPGATLGDVLHEELGLFIEPGAVVVLEPRRSGESVSGLDLGRALGRILVDLAERELVALKSVGQPASSQTAHHRLGARLSGKFRNDGFGLEAGFGADGRSAAIMN